jgi:GNAT superfamily N-acetyltransferase
MLTIKLVRSSVDRRRFAQVARTIYPADSPWAQPLNSTVMDYLDPRRNPFFHDGEAQAYLASDGQRVLGRVLAHVWRRHHRLHTERVGYFGFFECADDPDVARALLERAVEFVRARGCTAIRGPFNMTAAQEMGVVTSGFGREPAVDMVYTAPWYPALFAACGFLVCFRMQTWRNDNLASLDPDAIPRPDQRASLERAAVRLRPLDRSHRDQDLEHFREVTCAAFLGNFSFVPITRAEWQLQVGPVAPLVDPALMWLAEVDSVPVGVTFAVPDFNPILRRLQGRLTHPAVVGLLRRRPTDRAVIILLAVRKQYQGLGISRALNAELVRALKHRGYRSLAMTWVALENTASRAQAESLGMRPWHDLVMYERPI